MVYGGNNARLDYVHMEPAYLNHSALHNSHLYLFLSAGFSSLISQMCTAKILIYWLSLLALHLRSYGW